MSDSKKPRETRSQRNRKQYLKLLRSTLAKPELRGRVVSVSEACRRMFINRNTFNTHIGNAGFAQEWFALNQDAPIDAKAHYKQFLEDDLSAHKSETIVTTRGKNDEAPKEIFIPRKVAKEKTVRLGRSLKSSITDIKSMTTTVVTEVVPVDPKEALIDRIRESYVMADLGETPSIREIMQGFGLIDASGKVVGDLSEEEVRKRMVQQDWRGQRADHLHTTLDLIPEEVKLITMVRNVEIQKVLYNQIKVLNRQHMQWVNTGEVLSFDKKTVLPYEPDLGTMATLAEVMRRMVDGGGNVQVLINNFNNANGGGQGQSAFSQLSIVSKKYLTKLADMEPAQIGAEIDKLEKLRELLEGNRQKVSIEEIEDGTVIEMEKEKKSET